MKKLFLSVALGASLLSGCATTTGVAPKLSQSGFDGSKRIEVMPHGAQCKMKMVCPAVGAVWNSKESTTGLVISIANSIVGIQGASLNIDGKAIDLGRPIGLTSMDTQNHLMQKSENRFVVPYALIDEIINGKRVWLRVNTTDGVMEDAIIDENGDSKAYHALKRFKTSVEAAKAQP